MKTLLTLIVILALAAPASADLLLTEVFYDHSSGDDTFEWVEILNTTDVAVDLNGYIVAWGGTDYSYGSVVLTGTIGPCATYVVGGPVADAENGMPVFDQAVNLDADIQNGGTASDGVALFLPGANVLADTPLDAVIYDSPNTNGLIDETGAVGTMDVDDAPAGSTIERVSAAGDWVIQPVPDPNNVVFNFLCGSVVPDEEQAWGTIKALYR
jgi:hypothetical protein